MKLKNLTRTIATITMMLINCYPILAHDFEKDGIYYKITSSEEKTVAVTYRGSGNLDFDEYSGDIVIPESVYHGGIKYSVTSIYDYAFSYCKGLTGIVIPNSVVTIGNSAFSGCTGLKSLSLGSSIESIRPGGFWSCTNINTIFWNIKNHPDFNAPSDVPFIEYAQNILQISFGDSVEHIPSNLCNCMKNLSSIKIPHNVKSIGNDAFYNCNQLSSIIWNAANCEDFTESPFTDSADNISQITFGDSVEYIPSNLCNGMKNLSSIEIPESVTYISESSFKNCDGLTKIVWNAINCNGWNTSPFYYSKSNITSFTFGESVESIPKSVCNGMNKLSDIKLPDSVKIINNRSFYECSALTDIQIPGSVSSIGLNAFYGCNQLSTITWNAINCEDFTESPFSSSIETITTFKIGNSVEHIPAYLCTNLKNIKTIDLPNTIKSIGESAFEGCLELATVNWNVPIFSISRSTESPFYDVRKRITSFNFGDSVVEIPQYICYEMSNIKSIEIPLNTTKICDYAFYKCYNYDFTDLKIPDSVVSIGICSFGHCSSLKSIVLGNSVELIGDYAFSGCELTSLKLGNSITEIGDYAFIDCNLTSIEIPKSVTKIGESVFSVASINKIIWNAINCQTVYYSPFSTVSGANVSSIVFGNEVQHIPARLCENMNLITQITIPNSVESIGSWAFSGCSGITSLNIPNSVMRINNGAFSGCDGLTSIVIPENIEYIGSGSFFYTNITDVTWNAIRCSDFTYLNDYGDTIYYTCFDSKVKKL